MRIFLGCLGSAIALAAAAPALAQDTAPPKPITITGSVGLVSDYRFRGVSQSDKKMALQGGATVTHESGVYGGFWSSNLAGWGTFGGPNLELDLFAGYKHPIGGGAIDVGVTYYSYPGGAKVTDFFEPYVKLSGTVGPVNLLAGVAYAPKQRALGNVFFTGAANQAGTPNRPRASNDNFYIWGDGSVGLGAGFLAKGHVGYSKGNPGLGPNGTSVTPTGDYIDYLVGVDYTRGPVTLGIAYTGTDISRAKSAYLLPNFASQTDGSSIASGTLVAALTFAF